MDTTKDRQTDPGCGIRLHGGNLVFVCGEVSNCCKEGMEKKVIRRVDEGFSRLNYNDISGEGLRYNIPGTYRIRESQIVRSSTYSWVWTSWDLALGKMSAFYKSNDVLHPWKQISTRFDCCGVFCTCIIQTFFLPVNIQHKQPPSVPILQSYY